MKPLRPPLFLIAVICLFFNSSTLKAITDKNENTVKNILSNPTDIHGLWIERKKKKIAIWIEDCDATICGHIYWMKKPLNKKGQPKLDPHNPDKNLRKRTQCGMRILSQFVKGKNNSWKGGKIYNPKNGSTYSSKIQLSEDGILKVRGYLGFSLFGKTLKWERPQKKLQHCD